MSKPKLSRYRRFIITALLIFTSLGFLGLGFELGRGAVNQLGSYYLDYPFGPMSYYVGKFTNDYAYLINLDTWQCEWYSDDDLAVINAAITNTTRGTICLSDDIFYLDGAIEYASNITIAGCGKSTILYLNDAADTDVFYNPDNTVEIHHLRITNLKIDGNQAGQTDGALATLNSGINLTNVHNSEFDNLWIEQCKRFGIEARDSSNIQIRDSLFIEAGGDDDVSISDGCTGFTLDGLRSLNHSTTFGTATERSSFEFEDGASNITVSNCIVLGSPTTTHTGFSIKQHDNYPACRNIIIDGCFVEGAQYSFRVWRQIRANREPPEYITFSDCEAIGYVHAGFHARGAEFVTFDNCRALNGSDASTSGFRLNHTLHATIKNSWGLGNRNGIRLLEGCNYTTIEDCQMLDNLYGITVNDGSGIGNFNTTIWNNVCTDTRTGAARDQLIGIRTLSNADYTTIINNYVENNIDYGIWFVDTNIVIRGNIGNTTENCGVSEASNNDYIAHGCDITPTVVQITLQESTANYFYAAKTINGTHFRLYLYDDTAGALETVDQTILWCAYYQNP